MCFIFHSFRRKTRDSYLWLFGIKQTLLHQSNVCQCGSHAKASSFCLYKEELPSICSKKTIKLGGHLWGFHWTVKDFFFIARAGLSVEPV